MVSARIVIDPVGRDRYRMSPDRKFLPPQCRIVGQCQHHAVPKWLLPGRLQHGLPLLVIGDPGKLGESGNQSAVPGAAKAFAGSVTATTNGIVRRAGLFP